MKTFLTFVALLLVHSSAHADCKADVDGAFAKLRENGKFRLATKIVNDQGSLTMQVDYVLPDRMHQRVSLGESPQTMETIAIGDKVWSNQGQGWVEVPKTFAETIVKQIKDSVASPAKQSIDYACLGDSEFEGKTYAAYKATLPAAEQAKSETAPKANVQTVYIDKGTGLPVRNIVAPADAPEKRVFDGTFSQPENLDVLAPATN